MAPGLSRRDLQELARAAAPQRRRQGETPASTSALERIYERFLGKGGAATSGRPTEQRASKRGASRGV